MLPHSQNSNSENSLIEKFNIYPLSNEPISVLTNKMGESSSSTSSSWWIVERGKKNKKWLIFSVVFPFGDWVPLLVPHIFRKLQLDSSMKWDNFPAFVLLLIQSDRISRVSSISRVSDTIFATRNIEKLINESDNDGFTFCDPKQIHFVNLDCRDYILKEIYDETFILSTPQRLLHVLWLLINPRNCSTVISYSNPLKS